MKRSIRIVCYAVNGSGTGHVTRLIAISRWLRRYASWAGVRAEIYFLTSSEADGLFSAERFAAFKLPSKTVVQRSGIDKTTYLALAKQWVWHSLGTLRPDLFVVDTFPRGSFGELLNALDLAKHRALVFRPMLEEFASRPDVQALLPLYDTIIVPEHEADVRMTLPDAARARTRFVGPIAVREKVELMAREDARRRLGIDPSAQVAYVSAGGGGDASAEQHMTRVIRALLASDATLHVVAGAGPLYGGELVRDPRVAWLVNEPAAEIARAFDVAVTAAGYNTFVELMLAGVPTLFVPQSKIADDQAERAARAVRAGAGQMLELGASDAEIATRARSLLDPAAHEKASLAARALVPRSAARKAAAELLRVVLGSVEVDRAEAAVGDRLLEAARELAIDEERLTELMHLLDGEGGKATPARELRQLLERGKELVRRGTSAGLASHDLLDLGRAVLRRAAATDAAAREAAIREALERMQPDQQPAAEPRQ